MINTEQDRNISIKKVIANMFGQIIAKNSQSKTTRHFSKRVDIMQDNRLEQIPNLINKFEVEVNNEQANKD